MKRIKLFFLWSILIIPLMIIGTVRTIFWLLTMIGIISDALSTNLYYAFVAPMLKMLEND